MIDNLKKPEQKLYGDVVPMQMSPASFGRLLKNLLAARVSIRDLGTIVEAVAEALVSTKDIEDITEKVRLSLARQICAPFINKAGQVPLVSLGSQWSQDFYRLLKDEKSTLLPSQMKAFYARLNEVYQEKTIRAQTHKPPLLVSAPLRAFVQKLVYKVRQDIAVVSDAEVTSVYQADILAEL